MKFLAIPVLGALALAGCADAFTQEHLVVLPDESIGYAFTVYSMDKDKEKEQIMSHADSKDLCKKNYEIYKVFMLTKNIGQSYHAIIKCKS